MEASLGKLTMTDTVGKNQHTHEVIGYNYPLWRQNLRAHGCVWTVIPAVAADNSLLVLSASSLPPSLPVSGAVGDGTLTYNGRNYFFSLRGSLALIAPVLNDEDLLSSRFAQCSHLLAFSSGECGP
ncbi:MAG TPA: hypothetical protein VFA15_08365 [Nitrososphaera sp.]|nr:hypothetical protein [Nitrososphaera sp.]